MSSFVCDECGSMDNTALTRYWFREGPALCYACDPKLEGDWHGAFPRVQYNPERHQPVNR